jgi:hypothetical protein
MEPAVQCTLNRVRHEDLHLALAEILDVVIQSPVLELFAFGRAHGLPKPFESQKVVPPQLLRPLLNRHLGGGLLEVLGRLLVASLEQHRRSRRGRYVLLEPLSDLEKLRQGLHREQERRVGAARRIQDLSEVPVSFLKAITRASGSLATSCSRVGLPSPAAGWPTK